MNALNFSGPSSPMSSDSEFIRRTSSERICVVGAEDTMNY